MKTFRADLHIHTALSPCGGAEMTPPAIVEAAAARGLDLIAICDHNAAANIAPCITAADQRRQSPRVAVIAGMEITTAEEVHLLAFFPSADAAGAAAEEVQASLPEANEAYYRRFGQQHWLDADGRVIGVEGRMLAVASALDLVNAAALVRRHAGLIVAAHVDRPSFSVLSQLGLFPTEPRFDAAELFSPCGPDSATAWDTTTAAHDTNKHTPLPPCGGLPLLASSDAHCLDDIGRVHTECDLEEATFEELRLALHAATAGGCALHNRRANLHTTTPPVGRSRHA